MNRTEQRIICRNCGKEFHSAVPNKRYCSAECSKKGKIAVRTAWEANRKKASGPSPLDLKVKRLREQGLTYAEYQKRQTLQMIKEQNDELSGKDKK